MHPLESVDHLNPRPGLRRWIAPNTAMTEGSRWKEAWASIHHDGSVTIATAIGGHRTRNGHLPGERIESSAIECAVADFMALIRAVSKELGLGEYEVRVGVEWSGETSLAFDGTSLPIARYTPVAATVRADVDDARFFHQVHDLAEDCVNQGGIMHLEVVGPPPED